MSASKPLKAEYRDVVRDLAAHERHARSDEHGQWVCCFCGAIRGVEGRSRQVVEPHRLGCLWVEARALVKREDDRG